MSELKETRYAMSDKAYGLLTPDGKLWPAAGAEEDALYWLIAAAATGDITPEAVRAKLEAIGYRTTLVDITIAAPPTVNLEAGAGDLVERIDTILNEDAPNKWVWKTHTTQDEWIRETLLPVIREAAAQLAAVAAENARLREALAALIPYVDEYWDEGPSGEGWQSAELSAKIEAAHAALSPQ